MDEMGIGVNPVKDMLGELVLLVRALLPEPVGVITALWSFTG
jgi:hypothetical protein